MDAGSYESRSEKGGFSIEPSRLYEESGQQRLKGAVGLLLLLMGIIGVVWIAYSIMTLSTAPQSIPIIGKFASFDKAARSLDTPEGRIEMPEGLYYAVGIFLYVLVLAIGASLVKALITTGANLLNQEMKPVMNWFRDEMRRLREHLEKRPS
jgi:hypothetical protein